MVSIVLPHRYIVLICRWKRLLRQSFQIPFALAAAMGLAAVLTMIFAVEVFMSEVYSGPFKQFLVPALLIFLVVDRAGVYSNRPFFDFDPYVFGDLYTNFEISDELRESSNRSSIRKCHDP